jgi:hypothetical protein
VSQTEVAIVSDQPTVTWTTLGSIFEAAIASETSQVFGLLVTNVLETVISDDGETVTLFIPVSAVANATAVELTDAFSNQLASVIESVPLSDLVSGAAGLLAICSETNTVQDQVASAYSEGIAEGVVTIDSIIISMDLAAQILEETLAADLTGVTVLTWKNSKLFKLNSKNHVHVHQGIDVAVTAQAPK